MGQNQTKSLKEDLAFNQKQWKQLSVNQFGQKCNNLFLNQKLRLWAERTVIISSPHNSIEQQMAIYHYRKNSQSPIVNVYAAQHQINRSGPLCGNNQLIDVVYERIPLRLGDLRPLNFLDSLYVLSQSIRGFKHCFQKVGLFEVNEDMVGLNSEGFVKVWLNKNFAQNHPSSQRLTLQVTNTDKFRQSSFIEQKMMLKNVVGLIESKSQNKAFPKQFSKKINQNQTFADAYCQIQQFCQSNQLWIPDRIALNSYFPQIKDRSSHIADFKNESKDEFRVTSTLTNQHATYLPNLTYEYPRNTYLNGPYMTGEQSKTVGNQKKSLATLATNKYSPVIYENRPSKAISETVLYPQPRLKQTFINYNQYFMPGRPK